MRRVKDFGCQFVGYWAGYGYLALSNAIHVLRSCAYRSQFFTIVCSAPSFKLTYYYVNPHTIARDWFFLHCLFQVISTSLSEFVVSVTEALYTKLWHPYQGYSVGHAYSGIRALVNFDSFFRLNAIEMGVMRIDVKNNDYKENSFVEHHRRLQMKKKASRSVRLDFVISKVCAVCNCLRINYVLHYSLFSTIVV